MVNRENRIAGVVILYNPNDSVYENIESYREQVDELFAYDNSETKNFSLINKLKKHSNLIYIDNDKNKGVAEVLNSAAEKAINIGYDFLLTMDQDSLAPKDLVKKLLSKALENDRTGIVSPLHSNKYNTHLKFSETIEEKVMSAMTSGNVLSLNVFKNIGPFRDDFFIDYVDLEYCIRMNYNNYNVIRVNDTILRHSEGNLTKKKIFSKVYYPSNNPPTRYYYKTRNLLYLRDIYKEKYPYPLKKEYDAYIRNVVKMVLFEKQKLLKLRLMFIGVLDYLRRKSGRKF